MTMIRPFECYHAHPDKAAGVACPAYDAMTPAQRHNFAVANPDNYLNVMRSTDEFPEFERPSFDLNLQRNTEKLQQLLKDGTYVQNSTPGFYLYRLEVDGHVQTGLVAELPIEEFLEGRIKKHEHTRRDKEDALILYRDEVRASATPITMTYPALDSVDAIAARVQKNEPLINFTSDDGVKQTLWFVGDENDIHDLQAAFADVEALYLTDGHHRSAVCERWAQKRRDENPDHNGTEAYNFVMTAIFPDRENRILEYNRYVRGLSNLSVDDLLEQIKPYFEIDSLNVDEPAEAAPKEKYQFAMYLDSKWYKLTAYHDQIDHDDPVRSLDVCYLQDYVLGPILGIDDPRTDPRIEYVPGAFGIDELKNRVDEDWGVAFACFPTSIGELMNIADAGEVMPPKSTWFDPKVRSGLLVRLR
ncbi:MAG: DUF1015 family protein [Pseudomonadota bacterium]